MAAEIRATRAHKRIVAMVNPRCSSGAYWIASAAGEISMTPTGQVGGIGISVRHADQSRADEIAGRKTTLVSAGRYKVESNPLQPLSESARAHLQSRVDDYYSMFVSAVAKGRGESEATVRQHFGQGRDVGAHAALLRGMVDRVETLDELLKRA
jgi:ClpP class serine protease